MRGGGLFFSNSPFSIALHCRMNSVREARWRSGRASDSESRSPGFDSHKWQRVVSLSKTHLLPTVLVKPRKRWLRPDITEKLLTWPLSLKATTNIVLCRVATLILSISVSSALQIYYFSLLNNLIMPKISALL